MGERERQLTPPLPSEEHPQHDPGHHPVRGTKRGSKGFTLAQAPAGGSEGVTQRSSREGLARGDRPLERYARGDQRRDALEHDGEVAAARRTT